MCCARDSSRIDMIMNIYREKEGEKRRSSKCTNGSLVSPLIMNAFLSPFFSLFFFSSDCRSGGRERERKDNWTVSFSPMREREREKTERERSVEASRQRIRVFSRCSGRKAMFINELAVVSVLLLILITRYQTSSLLLPPFYWNQTTFRYAFGCSLQTSDVSLIHFIDRDPSQIALSLTLSIPRYVHRRDILNSSAIESFRRWHNAAIVFFRDCLFAQRRWRCYSYAKTFFEKKEAIARCMCIICVFCFARPHLVFSRQSESDRSIVQLFRSCWVNLFSRIFISLSVPLTIRHLIALPTTRLSVCLFVCV